MNEPVDDGHGDVIIDKELPQLVNSLLVVQLIDFLFQFALPGFRRIRRQIAAIDGEQFIAQQALFMTDQQYLLKQAFDLDGVTAYK